MSAKPWRQYLAFAGPALLVSVGYMDPGNWSTDLQAGAQFKYQLLWIVGLASAMAIVVQVIAARLGVVTGKDLAQCCRDHLPGWTRWPNWISCEIAIAACDLAEAMGSAVALHLLFPRISLFVALLITAFDVLLLLALQRFGMRLIEALILVLIATIGFCFFIEIFVLPKTTPNFPEMGRWLFSPDIPGFLHSKDLVALAVGIIGATVMPHNLYLHSALGPVQAIADRRFLYPPGFTFQHYRDRGGSFRRVFCQRRHPGAGGGGLLSAPDGVGRAAGRAWGNDSDYGPDGLDSGGLPDAAALLGTVAASMLFAVGLLASGQKQHHHGYPGRPGGDGGVHALEDPAVGAAADHAGNRHHSGDYYGGDTGQ